SMIIDFNYFKQNVSLNSQGLRDKDYSEKKLNETRILALGDSFLFGAVWDVNQVFIKVFERELNKNNKNKEYSVVNTGVSGYGSYEEKEFLKRDGSQFNPDVAIYFFYLNDIESDLGAPQAVVLDNGCAVSKSSLNLSYFSAQRLTNWLVSHSRAYVFFRFIMINENSWLRNSLYYLRNFLVDLNLTTPPALQYKILLSHYDEETSLGWNATLSNIKEMNVFSKNNNLKFLVIFIPMKFQVYDSLWEDYKKRNKIGNSTYDFKKTAKILNELSEQNNFRFIDLTPLIRNKIIKENITEPIYYEGDAHFNIIGNELVGKVLHDELKEDFK
ncbi:MAG: SGNH/GDSL hydrolase family protein, partial [Nanoarchaeota archaeon]